MAGCSRYTVFIELYVLYIAIFVNKITDGKGT